MLDFIDKISGIVVILGTCFFLFGLIVVISGGMMLIDPNPYYQFRWWGL
jgi:hypothetical protein